MSYLYIHELLGGCHMEHLVYCDTKAKVLSRILDGTKTMIIRGAAGRKLPHGRVFEGETLFFIENNGTGRITAKATVKSVLNSVKMTEEESIILVNQNQDKLKLTKEQMNRWAGKKVLCLIEIQDVTTIEPLIFSRQKNMDDWIAVENITSILSGIEGSFK
jgi:hypothetical protein